MADDVFFVEGNDFDSFDALEPFQSVAESRFLGRRQVYLGHIACDDHFAAHSKAGKEHFELERRSILGFIENDDGVGECASAHKSERRNLDCSFLHVFGQFRSGDHVLEGVIERLQIRVYFLLHVSRKETEFLSGFDGGSGENDTSYFFVFESPYGECDCRISLTGSGRSDGEEKIVLLVRIDKCLLVERAGIDGLAVDTMEDQVIGSPLLRFIAVEEHKDVLFREAVIADTELLAESERVLKMSNRGFRTGYFDLVSPCNDAYIGVLVFETEDVRIIDPVEGRRIEGILKIDDRFHSHKLPVFHCITIGEAR